MINRAIIEIKITKEQNDERFEKIELDGMDKKYIQIMREIYSAVEDTYNCPHIRIEAVFGDGMNHDYGKFTETEDGMKYETIFFKYYLEFEDDVDFIDGTDLYDLIDLSVNDVNGDEVYIGWIGHKEADYDLIIEDGVDWTIKKKQ